MSGMEYARGGGQIGGLKIVQGDAIVSVTIPIAGRYGQNSGRSKRNVAAPGDSGRQPPVDRHWLSRSRLQTAKPVPLGHCKNGARCSLTHQASRNLIRFEFAIQGCRPDPELACCCLPVAIAVLKGLDDGFALNLG